MADVCAQAAFVLAALAAPAAAQQSTFEGVLDRTSGHGGILFTVELKNGTMVVLPERPVTEYSNESIPLLSTIRVTCTLDGWRAKNLVANCTDLRPVTVISTKNVEASAFKVSAFTRETSTGVSFA